MIPPDHQSGRANRATKLNPPAALVFQEQFSAFSEARCREAQIKRWSAAKKEALCAGNITHLKQLAVSHDHLNKPASMRIKNSPKILSIRNIRTEITRILDPFSPFPDDNDCAAAQFDDLHVRDNARLRACGNAIGNFPER